MKRANLVILLIMTAIAAATVWSVRDAAKREKRPPAPERAVSLPAQALSPEAAKDDFFEKLYDARLKEEGDRSSRVEEMIRRGELSSHPAMHAKETDVGGK